MSKTVIQWNSKAKAVSEGFLSAPQAQKVHRSQPRFLPKLARAQAASSNSRAAQ